MARFLQDNDAMLCETLKKRRWSILLLVIFSAYVALVGQLDLWSWLAVQHMRPAFADLQGVLAASDCHRAGYNVFIENPCDRWGREHAYGRLWLLIGNLGLTLADAAWLGIAITVTFVFAVIMLADPHNLIETIVSALILMSPPIMLGIERANSDILIFLLLCAAGYLLAAKRRSLEIASLILVYLATELKFYPVASLTVYAFWLRDNSRFLLVITLISSLLLACFIWLRYEDLLILKRTIPILHSVGPSMFGAQTVLNDLRLEAPAIRHLLTLGLGLAAFLAALRIAMRIKIPSVETPSYTEIFFVIGFSILLFAFFVITNYYYRCVFFLLLLPYLFKILRVRPMIAFTRSVVFSIFGLLAISFWAESVSSLIQKTCWFLVEENIRLVESSFLLIEHVCMWIAMTLLLAISLRVVTMRTRRNAALSKRDLIDADDMHDKARR